jgi:hypothetical protein
MTAIEKKNPTFLSAMGNFSHVYSEIKYQGKIKKIIHVQLNNVGILYIK